MRAYTTNSAATVRFRKGSSTPTPATVHRIAPAKQLVAGFAKAWLPKLVAEQIKVQQVQQKAQTLAQRSETEHQQHCSKLRTVASLVQAPLELTEYQQDVIGARMLTGPVLDLSLLGGSLSSTEPLDAYPLHTRSSSTSSTSRHMKAATSSASIVAEPTVSPGGDWELAAMANSIQQANNLLRRNDQKHNTALEGMSGLLVDKNKLDSRAEAAYKQLMSEAQSQAQSDSHAQATDHSSQQQQQQQPAECVQQLVAVYSQPGSSSSSGSSSGGSSPVHLLRLPGQQQEYEQAQQQGLLVVPLQCEVGKSGRSGAVSAEELAWSEQQERLQEQQQVEQDVFFGRTPSNSGHHLDSSNAPSHTKIQVDVGVHIPTRPGQNVVLVGSLPSLGSWSVDGALPLKWTEGHVWRASIELPANCSSFEYKAVLRSSDGAVWEAGNNREVTLHGCNCFRLRHGFRG